MLQDARWAGRRRPRRAGARLSRRRVPGRRRRSRRSASGARRRWPAGRSVSSRPAANMLVMTPSWPADIDSSRPMAGSSGTEERRRRQREHRQPNPGQDPVRPGVRRQRPVDAGVVARAPTLQTFAGREADCHAEVSPRRRPVVERHRPGARCVVVRRVLAPDCRLAGPGARPPPCHRVRSRCPRIRGSASPPARWSRRCGRRVRAGSRRRRDCSVRHCRPAGRSAACRR